MDKDIHDINIDGEKIEGIVLDSNDTDASEDIEDKRDSVDLATNEEPENLSSEDKSSDESTKNMLTNDSTEKASDDDLSEPIKALEEPINKLNLIEKRNKRLKRIRLALSIPAILIIIVGMITLFIIAERNEKYENLLSVDYFYEGIFVDNIALGGLTYDEALDKLEKANKLREDNINITLLWEDEKVVFKKEDVETSFNTEEVLGIAWQEGRSGEDSQRYDYVISLIDKPLYFTTEMVVEPTNIETKVKAIALFRQSEPGDASVTFEPDPETEGSEWFEYTEPEKGVKTDPDALWEALLEKISESSDFELDIPKWEVDPTITIDDLKDRTQLIVQFKSVMTKNSNREHNVSLASSMINGTVLLPGEIFSMNETTGKRTKEAGYKEANVIVSGNQLVPGIAGGVCQVSGTLFNAAVRADLEIVERHHHSFELSYLTRGRDATVNYGTADLRFKNNTDHPIYISMYTVGRDVYAEIYGVPLKDDMTIELYVKTTQTVAPGPDVYVADSSIVTWESPKVFSARTGIKCTTYKDYYDADGKLVDRVQLHSDYYRPFPREIHYNPAVGIPG